MNLDIECSLFKLHVTTSKHSLKSSDQEIFGHPSVCKSNRLHVDIVQFSFGVYSMKFSKMIGNFPAVLNLKQLFLKLNWFICN